MPKKLPSGWVRATLDNVCLPVAKILPQDSPDVEFTYFDIGSIDNETNRVVDTRVVTGRNAPSRARQVVRKGDILFSTVRTYLRKIARIEYDYPNPIASTGFTVLRPGEGISSEFLFFQILTEQFLQPIHQLQSGTSYPAVRERDVLAQSIVLAPSNEQERIVAKLNSLLSSLEQGLTKTRLAEEQLLEYRASVLQQAVTGEITEKWRKSQNHKRQIVLDGKRYLKSLRNLRRTSWEKLETDRLKLAGIKPKTDKWKSNYPEPVVPKTTSHHILPSNWGWGSIDQVATRVTVGYVGPMKSEYVRSGIPFLRSQNVRPNRFEPQGLLFISRKFHSKLSKSRIVAGDVVVVRSGAVGTTCVIPKHLREANCSDLVVIQRPLIEPEFIAYYMNSVAQRDVEAGKVGIALTHFNTRSVASLGIPVPSPQEQREIVAEVERRLLASDKLQATLAKQIEIAQATRDSILTKAFSGKLVRQDATEPAASTLLENIAAEKTEILSQQQEAVRLGRAKRRRGRDMKESVPTPDRLVATWKKLRQKADAKRLFVESGYTPEQVVSFYEAIRANSEICQSFRGVAQKNVALQESTISDEEKALPSHGHFRLVELWLENFKNLKDYTIIFDPGEGLDVTLGWNGTGKSNLFEALVIIFRDLHGWWEKNRWPDKPMEGFRLKYEIGQQLIDINWLPSAMKRPEIRSRQISADKNSEVSSETLKREHLPLPRFVFGYYSGPTNRLAEHFLPMKQAHYERLRKAKADDAKTLAHLLEQRRFFCAETHHAKYVLLAFSYKEDEKIDAFLKDRLRIVGFESALFIIRKPRWAKPGTRAETFWGATGIMRRVMERLRRHAIAPMVLKQKVSYGYRATLEDHYYFFLPDLESLHSFAAEYENARSFFLALESTDFSELIYDVKIQVRVKASVTDEVSITFHQLSEGEQQLLMVLGLMRFTKSHQSLVLLDEPDTHINPHWSINYLKDLGRVMSGNGNSRSSEQHTSQILMASHDPLVIASLVKEQIHLLKRDPKTGACRWYPATVNPRGLGFTGILTSEMFGFRSDLDPETLADLDNRVRLVAKEKALTKPERVQLEEIDQRLKQAGFFKAFSDPYYSAFVRAWGRRHSQLMAGQQFLTEEKRKEIEQIANEVLKEAVAEVESTPH